MKLTQHAKTILLITAIAMGLTISAQAKAQMITIQEGQTYAVEDEDMIIVQEGLTTRSYSAYPEDMVIIEEGPIYSRRQPSVIIVEHGEIEPEPLFFFFD